MWAYIENSRILKNKIRHENVKYSIILLWTSLGEKICPSDQTQ